MDGSTLAAYLDRIGAGRPAVLDTAALGALHLAHQRTVPFENLSIHLGEPISLDEADLIAKIVTRRRGGFCYELNGAYPLRYDGRDAQDDPGGRFVLADAPDGDVDVAKDGKPQYRIEPRKRALADFVPTCWWQQTSPDSHFTWSTVCSRLTGDGRISLSGRTLIRTSGGVRTEEDLGADDAVLAGYREHFGVVLDRVPVVAGT